MIIIKGIRILSVKRNIFSFTIVCTPNLDSNTPSRNSYSIFGPELLRSARTTNDATISEINSGAFDQFNYKTMG